MTKTVITNLFEQLKTKDIYCLGHGKHFRNCTLPFLKDSGLIERLRGFVDVPGDQIVLDAKKYESIRRAELASFSGEETVLLVAVAGYREILSQLRADSRFSHIKVIPSVFPEALYEDLQMLDADQAPQHFRKHDIQVIPKVIHAIWFPSPV